MSPGAMIELKECVAMTQSNIVRLGHISLATTLVLGFVALLWAVAL
jgi:hypothetical protein